MHFRHWLLASMMILLAGMLAACGSPEDLQSNDQSPSRADLIARLQSPTESEELTSFRIKTGMTISGELPEANEGAGETETAVVSMQADVQTDPKALHLTTELAQDEDDASGLSIEAILIGDQFWMNLGDGWYLDKDSESDDLDLLLDSFTKLGNPFESFTESPDTPDLLEEAEIVGVEEVNGYRTTHFRLTTEAFIAILMESYDSSAAVGPACEDLESSADGSRDLDDGEEMAEFFKCMGAAVIGELPPPDEYIKRYEVDLWVSDDGFVMRQQTTMEFAFMPFMPAFSSDEDSSFAMTMSSELYDLNGDFEINAPESE